MKEILCVLAWALKKGLMTKENQNQNNAIFLVIEDRHIHPISRLTGSLRHPSKASRCTNLS